MMTLMILIAHLAMSFLMFMLPHMTRREILFGIVVPADFRSRPEARRAIRHFQISVAIAALAGVIGIALVGPGFSPIFPVASMLPIGVGIGGFVLQNSKLKTFAARPQPVRELELSPEPERLPWFAWIGLVPLLFIAVWALYLHNNSEKRIYGPLIFGAEMNLWLFGLGLAMWYGSRRSEPLRRPGLAVFVALGWIEALMMPSLALRTLINIPSAVLVGLPMAIIASSVIYLIKKNRESRGPVDPTPNECWKGGMLYYNPNDPVLFVGRRDGAGFTLNMGNPWSWAVIGSPLLLAVSAFFVMS